ncbi:hypothetical protein N7G274_004244 [Stereocaulon virgatum]|uniref:Uncharacterized protein n=1 Tax=Stereocaulon virgatum TaxID=373712 RepID=A0ABR4ABD7_9LECA
MRQGYDEACRWLLNYASRSHPGMAAHVSEMDNTTKCDARGSQAALITYPERAVQCQSCGSGSISTGREQELETENKGCKDALKELKEGCALVLRQQTSCQVAQREPTSTLSLLHGPAIISSHSSKRLAIYTPDTRTGHGFELPNE